MSVWHKLQWEQVAPENPGVTLFRMHGALDGSKECYSFLEDVRKEVSAGLKHVVINLDGVERINSAGVGILCACYTSVTNVDGKLYLVGVNDRNQMLMKVVGLWDQLRHYPTEKDVVFE
jgi:anti-sigma B factor antagonist